MRRGLAPRSGHGWWGGTSKWEGDACKHLYTIKHLADYELAVLIIGWVGVSFRTED